MVWKLYRFFSIEKFDVRRTGPSQWIKPLTGKPYKGYVSRRFLAAIAATHKKVAKMRQADPIKEIDIPFVSPIICVTKPDDQL